MFYYLWGIVNLGTSLQQNLFVMFKLFSKGFQITNKSGITLSINVGEGGYNSNYHNKGAIISRPFQGFTSTTAEISIWSAEGKNYFETNLCKGWCSPEEVFHYMEQVGKANTLAEIKEFSED